MARFLVLGGYGAMGSIICRDLAESGAAEIVVAGHELEKATAFAGDLNGWVGKSVATPKEIDVRDPNLPHILMESGADVLINATWYEFNMKVMPAAIEAGVHYIDLGGLFHMTRKQLRLDREANTAGILCLLGMGSTPGTTNVMAAWGAQKFDEVDTIEFRSASKILEKTEKIQAPYSIRTIVDEFMIPPPIFKDGRLITIKPMSKKASISFPQPLGLASGYITIHSEIATIPKTINKGVKNVDFAVAFPPAFTALVKNIIDENRTRGKEAIIAELQKRLAPPTEIPPLDIDAQAVILRGRKKGRNKTLRLDTITPYHKRWRQSSGVDTGIPASIAAQWIAAGKIDARGVLPPESCIPAEEYFKELNDRDRGIKVYEVRGKSRVPLF